MSTLTTKQRTFIAGIASGLPKRTAAIQAGYSKKSAHAIAHETLNNPEVKNYLNQVMEENGISDSYIAYKLFELAEAETNGNPHWPARARALDMILKVRGCYSQELPEIKTEMTIEMAEARIKALLPESLLAMTTKLI